MTNVMAPPATEHNIAPLLDLALHGLEQMFDPQQNLFCNRLRLTASGVVREGVSHRYTMMCLLGLQCAREAGLAAPIDTDRVLDGLLRDHGWLDNIGDLGLLLWTCAASSRTHLTKFHSSFNLDTVFNQYADARTRPTMELSWFLMGLVFARSINAMQPKGLSELAEQVYELLRNNQGAHGLFGHTARWKSLAGAVRGHVGSFADQVYPIVAMAHFGRVFGNKEAQERAVLCAKGICDRQGPLGQWWWHYDSRSGRVIERYPVYSVHQHGMAPMALFAAGGTGLGDFTASIVKGLAWVEGANELHKDMKHGSAGLIWRSLYQRPLAKYSARLHLAPSLRPARQLRVLHECRSYELGWLLYAFARNRELRYPGSA